VPRSSLTQDELSLGLGVIRVPRARGPEAAAALGTGTLRLLATGGFRVPGRVTRVRVRVTNYQGYGLPNLDGSGSPMILGPTSNTRPACQSRYSAPSQAQSESAGGGQSQRSVSGQSRTYIAPRPPRKHTTVTFTP
jgi:hypothetical protein